MTLLSELMRWWNLRNWKCDVHMFLQLKGPTDFNPILSGLWNYVTERGGAIMARMDSSHPEAVCRHPKAQKWLPSNYFDLWLSIDTKNSTLWAVVLANPAVKRPWWKMKIFMQKYVNFMNITGIRRWNDYIGWTPSLTLFWTGSGITLLDGGGHYGPDGF